MFWRDWIQRKVRHERILALDLLRGTLMVVIISTHIPWAPSFFSVIGGRGGLFASAAEGFFAISGMLVGFIYGPRILKSTKQVIIKIWKRAAVLYLLAIFFTLFYTAWAVLFPGTTGSIAIYSREQSQFLFDVLTLDYTYGWADFLTRYAVFMVFAPFAVWAVAKGRAYIVAIYSFIVWILFRDVDSMLPFASWQVIFMYGIIIGYYLPHIEQTFLSLTRNKRKLALGGLWAVGALSFGGSILWIHVIPYLAARYEWIANAPITHTLADTLQMIQPYFDKEHVDPARIAIGIVWFAALYSFFRVYEKPINRWTRGVLDTLGKNSLFVYGLHAFIIFFIDLYLAPGDSQSFVANTLVTALVISIIYRMTKHRGIFARIRRKLLPSFTKEVAP